MEAIGYYNGKIEPLSSLMIPALDRGFYFGDGVYDFVLVVNDKPFALDDHLERFRRSAAAVKLGEPYGKNELEAIMEDLCSRVDTPDKAVYMQLTRGAAPRNHVFPKDTKPSLFMFVKPCKIKDLYKKVRLVTTEDRRFHFCNVKTINLLLNVLAAEEAEEAGAHEAVFVRDGYVTEGAHSNVHILKNGALITHPLDELILPGIARAHMIKQAKALGIPVIERPFTPDELFSADEVLISSTSGPIIAACEIDGRPVGGGDDAALSRLRDAIVGEIYAD